MSGGEDYQHRVEVMLGGRVICDRCNATLFTYADVCPAALNDLCPGYRAIEDASAVAIAQQEPSA